MDRTPSRSWLGSGVGHAFVPLVCLLSPWRPLGPSDPAPACPTLYPRSSGQPWLGLSPGPHTPAGPRSQAERVGLAFLLTLATQSLEKTSPALVAAWELPGDTTTRLPQPESPPLCQAQRSLREQEPALRAAPRPPPPWWGTDFGGQPKASFTEREASVSRAAPRVPRLAGPRLEGSRRHQPPTHVGPSRAWLPFCPHWRKNGPSCEKLSLSQPTTPSEERTRSSQSHQVADGRPGSVPGPRRPRLPGGL